MFPDTIVCKHARQAQTNALTSTIEFRRARADVIGAAQRAIFYSIFDPLFTPPALMMPEVQTLYAVQFKDSGMQAALDAINLDERQADIDEERAIANLDGEPLALALEEIGAGRFGRAKRATAIRSAGAKFAEAKAQANVEARRALQRHLSLILPQLQSALDQRVVAGKAKLLAAISDAADELAALDGVSSHIRQVASTLNLLASGYADSDFEGRIAKILAGPAAK